MNTNHSREAERDAFEERIHYLQFSIGIARDLGVPVSTQDEAELNRARAEYAEWKKQNLGKEKSV